MTPRPFARRAILTLAAAALACAAREAARSSADGQDPTILAGAARPVAADAPPLGPKDQPLPGAHAPVPNHWGESSASTEDPFSDRGRLRSAVEELAVARLGSVGDRAARALAALHGLLQRSAPDAHSLADLAAAISALVSEPDMSLDRADHVIEGLTSALAALRSLCCAQSAWGVELLGAAERAVARLDPSTPLGLQHAAVQDAFRALSDALLVLLERTAGAAAGACSC